MNIRQELSLEQQFELRVFEEEVHQLSQADAQALLVHLREAMIYQTNSFRDILKETWGIERSTDDLVNDLLA
ncbi:MAG: NblA/ycf18 family protein [Cyanobacteria bacterium P01_D01_bin.115]